MGRVACMGLEGGTKKDFEKVIIAKGCLQINSQATLSLPIKY